MSPNKKEGGWNLKVGSDRVRYDTKDAALNAAVAQARRADNAQVVIRKKDGTIQSERTYGEVRERPRGR